MQNYKQQFKGKKITVMGLGILGRGLGYTKFLAECGADLIVTDLKSKEQLASSLDALAKFKNIKFTIGKHKLEDFRNRDIIMKMAGVPLDSIYIEEAQKTGANIEMDVSLFIKSAPKTIVVGVTGTRGKSMTTMLIYEILKANEKFLKKKVYLGGNIRGVATLPLLKKVKAGDILVCSSLAKAFLRCGKSILPSLSLYLRSQYVAGTNHPISPEFSHSSSNANISYDLGSLNTISDSTTFSILPPVPWSHVVPNLSVPLVL